MAELVRHITLLLITDCFFVTKKVGEFTGSNPVLATFTMLPTPRVSESLKGVQSVLQGRPW